MAANLTPEETGHLKNWLLTALAPISDADTDILSDYVLALIKADSPEDELEKDLIEQLTDFLESNTQSFVTSFFATIRSKSYLNSAPPLPPPSSIPPPSANGADSRPAKRSRSNSPSSSRQPNKSSRLASPKSTSRQPYPQGSSAPYNHYSQSQPASHPTHPYSQPAPQPHPHASSSRPRKPCFDYHNRGYCARGDKCQYEHDAAPGTFPPPPLGFQQMMMAGWDPAMMAAMGMGGGSQQQQMEGQGGMTPSNGASATPASNGATLPSAGTGLAPSAGAVGMDGVDQPEGQGVPGMAGPGGFDPQQMAAMQQMMMLQQQGFFPQGGMPFPGGPPPNFQQGGRGGGGFRGRGGGGGFRGRGGSNGGGPSSDGFPRRSNPGPDTDTKPPADRTSTTLVVGSIPPSALALPPINAHFSKFGTVTNIAIDAPSARALVSFATNAEAYAAWKSEDVIFGSRFVKVLWHRPVMGHGQKGKEALDKSKEAMEKLKAGVEGEAVVAPKMSREQVLAKQRVLEGQIAKQKVLMMKVGREGIDKEEKAELMKELRVLAEEMKGGGEESLVRLDKGKAKGTTPAADGNGRGGEEEKKKALDRELEGAGRGMMEGVESAEGPGEEGSRENTEMLKRKLELLKAEASLLGVDPSAPPSEASSSDPYSSYPPRGRGRGRGRGVPRGRGGRGGGAGFAPERFSLDLRTKSIAVVGDGLGSDLEARKAVEGWYQSSGQVDTISTDEATNRMIVTFKSRPAAEQSFARGSNISELTLPVNLSWYNTPPSMPPTKAGTPAASNSMSGGGAESTEDQSGRGGRYGEEEEE